MSSKQFLIRKIVQPNSIFSLIRRILTQANPPTKRNCHGHEPYSIPSRLVLTCIPLAQFGTDEQCADALEASRWPQGFSCPGCGNLKYYLLKIGKHKNSQCKCCRLQTSLITGNLVPKHPLGAKHLVLSNLSNQPSQDRFVGTRP